MAGSDDKSVRRPCFEGPMDQDLAERLRAMAHNLGVVARGRDCDVRDLDLEDLRDAADLLARVVEEDRRRRSKCELRN